jgi:hypothetical protein
LKKINAYFLGGEGCVKIRNIQGVGDSANNERKRGEEVRKAEEGDGNEKKGGGGLEKMAEARIEKLK